MRTLRLSLLAGIAAMLPSFATIPASAAGFPAFDAESCCKLCPEASDPGRYDTKMLSSYRTLVQGSDGWLFRSEADLLELFGPTQLGLARMSDLRQALRRRGTELVIVMQPPRGLMHLDKLKNSSFPYNAGVARASYERTLRDLRAAGFVVPALERLLSAKNTNRYFWRTDHHWTPEGTRLTAQIVAEAIRRMPQYKHLRKQKFVSRREGVLARGGTLGTAAAALCGYQTPKQYVPRYVTEAADEGGSSADLFGDESAPEVTLIGTSNSEPTYNFSGFLSEYLQADVLNAAVVGGGIDGALLTYLPSDEFRKNPPRILIWEMEHYHDLDDLMTYRQALPLLDDGCNGREALLDREVMLKQGNNEVLFNGGGSVRPIRGRDYILDLQFADPAVRELRGIVWYTSGNKDKLRIEHATRGPSRKGRFVTELRSDLDWGEQTFMGLDLEVLPPASADPAATPAPPAATGPQKVRARVCSIAQSGQSVAAPAAARLAGMGGASP